MYAFLSLFFLSFSYFSFFSAGAVVALCHATIMCSRVCHLSVCQYVVSDKQKRRGLFPKVYHAHVTFCQLALFSV